MEVNLEDEVHSMWVIWTSGLQECKGNFNFWSRVGRATFFDRDVKFIYLFCGGYLEVLHRGPRPLSISPLKFVGGGLASALIQPQVYVFQIPYQITTYKGKFYVHICAEYYSAFSKFHEIPIVASSMKFCFFLEYHVFLIKICIWKNIYITITIAYVLVWYLVEGVHTFLYIFYQARAFPTTRILSMWQIRKLVSLFLTCKVWLLWARICFTSKYDF
jgi:hypothetical protein